ncbi:MAG: restriction endonuclease subunit S [Thiomonas arsenitoxydans]|uniref:Restriction endonuclease subunit S n=1 Tax=Thiomonas arsenitoxydans (strain DSM 22701 / CIP 110005 / 3As) TaxID=426114 RepID=A0A8I1MY81_THIA3|nr:restriction endonuclease subunit S [Thiomonas arsenitoxydans]MBN8745856.1 restriction endonuclease subunit S [Thiomonas arsenitoxydans]
MKSTTFRFTASHVLYGRLRPYLNKIYRPDFDGHCSTEIFPLLPAATLDRNFLFYWLLQSSTVSAIDATSTGARMPRANMDAVMEFMLPVPPIPEQRRIVAILDEAFEAIAAAKANTEKNLSNAREVFESQRETMLSGSRTGWHDCLLQDLCDIKHGYAFEGEFFATAGQFVLLTPGNFFETGGYRDRREKQKFFVGEIPKEFVLPEGALLVAMTEQAAGLLGSPLLVPEPNRFLHNQRLGLVSAKARTAWDNAFFFHVFNLRRVRNEIHRTASGVKVRHTSPGKIGAVRVTYPEQVEVQRNIATRLSEVEDESHSLIDLLTRKLSALDELKQSLLHQAFTGALTAKFTDKQVAEVA